MPQDQKSVQLPKRNRGDDEHVYRCDAVGMVAKEGLPAVSTENLIHVGTGENLPPSEWLTFLRNHSTQIAAMDLFVVPSVTFELFYVFIIVRLARRDLVWINVTPHPTAEWLASNH
jgi:hypothetical protein